jgi:hypothetical protein
VLEKVFVYLQSEHMCRVKVEVVALDSTYVKVHPDGTGPLKKRSAGRRGFQRGTDNQTSFGCHGYQVRTDFCPVPW